MTTREMIGVDKVVADEYMWECIDGNKAFNDYVGRCLTHFVHFVVPVRNQEHEIAQDYPIPTDIEDVGGDVLLFTRKDNRNEIFIEFWR